MTTRTTDDTITVKGLSEAWKTEGGNFADEPGWLNLTITAHGKTVNASIIRLADGGYLEILHDPETRRWLPTSDLCPSVNFDAAVYSALWIAEEEARRPAGEWGNRPLPDVEIEAAAVAGAPHATGVKRPPARRDGR